MAQASRGAPVREARHDTTASKASPRNPSRASAPGSPTSPNRTVAPASSLMLSSGARLPRTPARGRTKQTTSWPRPASARTVARPMVPVAPSTRTRRGRRLRGTTAWTEFEGGVMIGQGCTGDGPRARPLTTQGHSLHHRPMPFDAPLQHLVHGPLPPLAGKDLNLGIAGEALRLDRGAKRSDVDYAIAHHAAIVEDIFGRHQPVADMERQQTIAAGARDLAQQLRVPPDVIDVERDAEHAGALRIEAVADIERLFRCVDAGAVGGVGRMQRLDRERHAGR